MKDNCKTYKVVYRCLNPKYILSYDTYIFDDAQKMAKSIKTELINKRYHKDISEDKREQVRLNDKQNRRTVF